MSRHRDILPEVVEILAQKHPECAIVLVGSVRRGTERPDSDLDLAIIVPEDCKKRTDQTWRHKGILMCLCYLGRDWMDQTLREQPYVFWPFSLGEVLHDPYGVAAGFQQRAGAFFAEHPDIVELWKKNLAQHSASKLDPNEPIGTFPDWNSFWDHIEKHHIGKEAKPNISVEPNDAGAP